MADSETTPCPQCGRPMDNGPGGVGPYCFWWEDCQSWDSDPGIDARRVKEQPL